ncbi:hypothetical protein G7Z17_g533 [Cylindrodendrum hubeiense]|uniref:Xylanolytic transcriptional activator regulatory domain-containing protein n=1 Tax=Cylindrodendrum hubeiense TaxID=595255 RepID=A0A9P5HGH6_9HYPO|nr:hypothetical protein G7Z17_g533 [Cylindrodendrum hubeiense]
MRNRVTVPASPPALRASSSEAPSTSETPSTIGPAMSEHLDEDQDAEQSHTFYTAHGRFSGEVAAAIDAKAGLAPAATSNLVPFVDAPLFVQRQEDIPLQKRDEEGCRYFQRAWSLLPPETILWKPGSVELVQCLMLMNRYLHCTNNQQKTWMTAGLAIRIAQSMCFHLPGTASTKKSGNDRQLEQRVWASCIAVDRIEGIFSSGSYQHDGKDSYHIVRRLELHEIGNQIQLAQAQTQNGLAARLGLPRLYQQDEYHAVVMQLDACLNKWENSLASDWKFDTLQNVVDRTSRTDRYLLNLRCVTYADFMSQGRRESPALLITVR